MAIPNGVLGDYLVCDASSFAPGEHVIAIRQLAKELLAHRALLQAVRDHIELHEGPNGWLVGPKKLRAALAAVEEASRG